MPKVSSHLVMLCCISGVLAAQEPLRVDSAVAAQNLIKKVEPEVPRIAQMANVGGTVRMEVTISTDGRVSNTKILSGHPMLRQSFINAVKQWEYKPFMQDGKPITVITEAEWTVPTIKHSASEEKAMEDYYPVSQRCRDLVAEQKPAEAEAQCRRAVAISEKLPADRILERSGARTFLAHALIMQRKIEEGIANYQDALRIDSQRRDERDADYASSHANLARAYYVAGRYAEADPHFERAVKIFEAAIVALPSFKQNYTARLKRTLSEWAMTKNLLGQTEEAKKLEQKADRL